MNKNELSDFVIRMKNNNFDLLRFIFAFIVFLVHAYVLSGAESLAIISNVFSSEIAVKSFFIVSGFLIFMSYENTNSNTKYFLKRVRRIYPAYFFVILASAVFGFIFSSLPVNSYLSHDLIKYIAANLVFLNFLHPELPGLLENNTLQAVNGALWTLKIEVMFYLLVPIFAIAFRWFRRAHVILVLYIASILYSIVMFRMAETTGEPIYNELQRQFPGQLAFFILGASAYYYFSYLSKYAVWLVVTAIGTFFFKDSLPWLLIEPIALTILVIYFACLFPCIGRFSKYGDFSYGIYIVHFPILQILISYGFFNDSPWLALGISGILILLISVLLWNYIEKPFLRKSSYYVSENSG